MGDVVKLAVLAIVLVGVLAFMLRGLRPRGGPGSAGAKSVDQLPRYTSGPATSGFVTGFVTAMAVILFVRSSAPTVSEAGAALACGVFFAVFSGRGSLTLRSIVAGAAGLLGVIPSFQQLQGGGQCSAADPFFSLAMGGLLVAVVVGATVFSSRVNRTPGYRWATLAGNGLARWLLLPSAVFGGLQVILFLTTPLGVSLSLTSSPAMGATLGVVGSVGFGLLAGFVPGLAILLGGAAIAVTQILVEAMWGSACLPPLGVGAVVPLVVFVVAYVVVTFVIDPFRRRFSG